MAKHPAKATTLKVKKSSKYGARHAGQPMKMQGTNRPTQNGC